MSPNQPKTPIRTVRIDDLWERVQEIAAKRGDTMTDIVRTALEDYEQTYGSQS